MDALQRKQAEDVLNNPAHEILLILDDVRSMHNVGSAFRTADAFGLSGIYLCGFTPCPPHRDIRKAALGSEDSVNWRHFSDINDALKNAVDAGYRLIAVEQAEGSISLETFQFSANEKLAFIFGNEVNGVSDIALKYAKECIEIPQWGAKHSLNISVSIGVVLWEIVRTMPH